MTFVTRCQEQARPDVREGEHPNSRPACTPPIGLLIYGPMELLQAKDIMVRDYQAVPEGMPLLEAVDRMRLVELQTKKIDVRSPPRISPRR